MHVINRVKYLSLRRVELAKHPRDDTTAREFPQLDHTRVPYVPAFSMDVCYDIATDRLLEVDFHVLVLFEYSPHLA